MTDDDDREARDPMPPKISIVGVQQTDLLGLGEAANSKTGEQVSRAMNKVAGILELAAKMALPEWAKGSERREIVKTAKALSQVNQLLAADPDRAEALKTLLIGNAYRQLGNIEAAAIKAIEYGERASADGKPVHEIDEDFMVNWVEGVKDVSNETVRDAWAKLLAHAVTEGEGRVSKPVVDLLKQLDNPTAKSIEDFFKIVRYGGWPSTRIDYLWSDLDMLIDFQMLEELGVIKSVRPSSRLQVRCLGYLWQSEKMIGSNLGFSAAPSVSVWSVGKRAFDLAQALRLVRGAADDQEFGYCALSLNLESLADDKHQHLMIRLHAADNEPITVQIAHPDNLFTKPEPDGTLSSEAEIARNSVAEQLDQSKPAIDEYALRVLKDYALNGRLQIVPEAEKNDST